MWLNEDSHCQHEIQKWKFAQMEKRKFLRFRTQDNAYAVLCGDANKIGKICDISINGLAFRYMAKEMSNKTHTLLDVFLYNDGFHIYNIPCTVVYDVKEPNSNSYSISQFRCGLKLEQVKDEHQKEIENFINNYTSGRA